ncbi:MAG: aminotransferase class I/II-fold pyridoxal phosphate-dependent enzyme, partial [Candidatus Competibacteraceae bacterium]|nr:aminotransferase class I/II-fold pyridoxal phosphate-dependent enzyme [Candidatus Competibacteraceae bacterium]
MNPRSGATPDRSDSMLLFTWLEGRLRGPGKYPLEDLGVKELRKLGWTVESPRASMFIWAKVNPEHLAHFRGSSDEFCVAMVEQAEVAMTPGSAFGPRGEGYVRLALVENEQRIRRPCATRKALA